MDQTVGDQSEPEGARAKSQLCESVSALVDGEAESLELRRLLASDDVETINESWQRYHRVSRLMKGEREGSAFAHLDISAQVRAAIAEDCSSAAGDMTMDMGVTTATTAKAASDHPAASSSSTSKRPAWLRPVAGFAVAASVAAGIVFTVQDNSSMGIGTPGSLPGVATLADTSAISRVGAPSQSSAELANNTGSRVYPVAGSSMQASSSSGPKTIVNYSAAQLPSASLAAQRQAELEAHQRFEEFMLRHTENAALNTQQGVISFARVASFEP